MKWIDQYTGNQYSIATEASYPTRMTAQVKTYEDVAPEYRYQPESKCAAADGNVCDKPTIGLLQRRHVSIDLIHYIDKESNRLEEVEAGLVHSGQKVYTEYPDLRREEWQLKTLPALKKIPMAVLLKESGMSRRALQMIRAGRRPYPKNQERLAAIVRSCV